MCEISDAPSVPEYQNKHYVYHSNLISILITWFISDSDRVVKLLSEALSMDSLSDLLKKEHRDSTEQLEILKEKLQSKYVRFYHLHFISFYNYDCNTT